MVADLSAVGVELNATETAATDGSQLEGKTCVVTGILTEYTRDEIHALITQHGGRAASSVSAKTDFLIAGEKAGSKLEKAKKLGVPVLSESDFSGLLAE